MVEGHLFEIIRIAIGRQQCLTASLSEEEWLDVYAEAKKQALVGICFIGVKKLKDTDQAAPRSLFLKWLNMVARIQKKNELIGKQSVALQKIFNNSGMQSCILKGMGVAQLYGSELSTLRQSGDIDVWMGGGFDSVVEYCRRLTKGKCEITRHHVEMTLPNGIDVEVHPQPSILRCWWNNKKLQRWFEEEAPKQMSHQVMIPDCGSIMAPTAEFNYVYLLLHIYLHLLYEGVGLRQVMDYYFLLNRDDSDCENARKMIKQLGMLRFTEALMWVLGEIFGLEREKMIVQPNEKNGRILLAEMMMSGNFGRYDKRQENVKDSGVSRVLYNFRHNLQIFQFGPEEVLCTPLWRLWHFMWRSKNGYSNKS